MRLLKLDQRVQQMLIDEMITEGHGRALIPISDPEEPFTLAMRVFDEKLSVRETEKLIKKLQEEKNAPETPIEETKDVSFIYKGLEEKLKKILGTKVEIKNKANNTGKIEIEYYSVDELDTRIEQWNTKSAYVKYTTSAYDYTSYWCNYFANGVTNDSNQIT